MSLALPLIAFCCLFGSALVGMRLNTLLPERHLKDESKDLLKVGLGIIGTSAGLVLGLLIASASGSYNEQRSNVIELATKIGLLDRVLAHYGPDARQARTDLRAAAADVMAQMWPSDGASSEAPLGTHEAVFDEIERLDAKTEEQRSVKAIALGVAIDIGRLRYQIYEQLSSSISLPLVVMLIFWFSVTFAGFGLFSPMNATTVTAMALCAISISGAIFLMLSMYSPFNSIVEISSAPMRDTIAGLGK